VLLLATTVLALSAPAEAARFGLFAPADRDGDGVPDRHDACAVVPETRNGYADHDGCPDHLAALDVVPMIGDTPVAVDITLTRSQGCDAEPLPPADPFGRPPAIPPTERCGTSASHGRMRIAADLVPRETVRVEARAMCYAAEVDLVVEPGRNHHALQLTPRFDQRVEFDVTDADGSPLHGATVEFDSLCAPIGAHALTDGRGTVRVGSGEHLVHIRAPGMEPVVQRVSDGQALVAVTLEAVAPAAPAPAPEPTSTPGEGIPVDEAPVEPEGPGEV